MKDEDDCADGCCQATAVEVASSTNVSGKCTDKCCTVSQAVVKDEDDCANDCCQAPAVDVASSPGAGGGCADKCCTANTEASALESSASCFDHLQAAMDRYEALLKRGLCLCRMAIDELGFNCCAPDAPLIASIESSALAGATSKSIDGKKVVTSTEIDIHPRCSTNLPRKKCSKEAPALPSQGDHDIEKAASREFVVLNVAGMTYTGCSKKMLNVLNAIPGLFNAQVTFVLGSAEFELDTNASGNTEKVLARIEKETGFKCFRIISGRQDLSVVMTAETANALQNAFPAGLKSVVKSKKDLYTVTYDPTIIRARSLLLPNAKLAPPSDATEIARGKRRLIETALSTAMAAILTIPVVVLEWSSNPIPE